MEKQETDIISTDEDTILEDTYKGSVYPYGKDIDKIEPDVREDPFSVIDIIRKYKRFKTDPDFQRNMVWNNTKKSRFIESLILNIPLPPLFFNQDKNGNYIVVDGKQRTTTIYSFVAEESFKLQDLEALPWLNGKIFSELEEKIQARIEDRKLPCYIIKPTVPMGMVYDIFNRINTGGTILTRQEVRNCIYLGKASKLLNKLSKENYFREAIAYGISEKRMKDREAILHVIAFSNFGYEKYRNEYNGMDDFLNKAMIKINKMEDPQIEMIEKKFRQVMEYTFAYFNKENFRIPTRKSRGRINMAMMASVCYFFWHEQIQFLTNNKKKIVENFKKLRNDTKYRDSIQYSTGDPARVEYRFNCVKRMLGET